MISITLEINEIGKRKAKEKNHKTKMWSFERTMLAKLWANQPEKKKERSLKLLKSGMKEEISPLMSKYSKRL